MREGPERRSVDGSTILFEEASLERIEAQDAEALLFPLFREERPPSGLLGAVDWRFGGRISRLIAEGRVASELGALSLLPARRRLPSIDKVLIVGMGTMEAFSEEHYSDYLSVIEEGIRPLAIRSLGMTLPGRALEKIEAAAAFESLIKHPRAPFALDLIVFDRHEAVKEMGTILATAKRRTRAYGLEG